MRMPAMQRAMSHFERANGVFESELGAKALPGNTIDDAPEAVDDAGAYGAQVVTEAVPNGEREHCHARRSPRFDSTLQLSRSLSANLRRAHWAFPHRAAAQQPSVVGALIRRRVLALQGSPTRVRGRERVRKGTRTDVRVGSKVGAGQPDAHANQAQTRIPPKGRRGVVRGQIVRPQNAAN